MRIVGHGIDIVEIERIKRMLDEHGERFVERCFSLNERSYCESGGGRRAERFAARFAVKEAAFKALGTGWRSGIAWTDVAVMHEPSGRPRLSVSGVFADHAQQAGVREWQVSLSHASGYAVASVLAIGVSLNAT